MGPVARTADEEQAGGDNEAAEAQVQRMRAQGTKWREESRLVSRSMWEATGRPSRRFSLRYSNPLDSTLCCLPTTQAYRPSELHPDRKGAREKEATV